MSRGGLMCRSAAPCATGIASGLCVTNHNMMTMEKETLKPQEESRDFFCVASDAFRLFAKRSSMMLGSAWAFAAAILIILIWGLTWPHVSLFGYVAAHY